MMRDETRPETEVAIVGAGPYGLSLAAHLHASRIRFRIFGEPMQSWSEQMPQGMLLKSDGFASSLFDPAGKFALRDYCAEMGIAYEEIGLPVSREVFVAYGQEFQRRLVPTLERTNISRVRQVRGGFELTTAAGEVVRSRRVVVAAGITHFGQVPPMLAELAEGYVSHSLGRNDLSEFAGKVVAVIGGGSSAVDIAALLHEAGASVHLIARRKALAFHAPSVEPRPLHKRLLAPRSGLGLGWRSRLCTDAPMVFRMLPSELRVKVVRRHLGPSPGWFVRDKVVGKFPLHLGAQLMDARVVDGRVSLRYQEADQPITELRADHVIAATGFRVDLGRLAFLDAELRHAIRTLSGAPVLSPHFESTVRGLHFVGVASSHTFGPLTRFAFGAKFTARRLSGYLTGKSKRDRREPVFQGLAVPASSAGD